MLDGVTDASHTRLIATSFDSKSIDVRLFALRRVAELGDPGLRERAETAWQAAEKEAEARSKDKKKRKEADPKELEEHQRSALLALACGSAAPLQHLATVAGSRDWPTWRASIEAAASMAAEEPEVPAALAAMLTPKAKGNLRAGALRLLAYAGTEEHVSAIAPMLDARENHVKIAAINALRRIVDGADPLPKLSTFDAIEQAQAWKKRI